LTRPEPRPDGTRQRAWPAAWLLSVALLSGLIYLFVTPLEFVRAYAAPGPWWALVLRLDGIADALSYVSGALDIGWDFLIMALAVQIARRALRHGLARQALILQFLLPVVGVGAWAAGLDDTLLTVPRSLPVAPEQTLHVYLPYGLLYAAVAWQLLVLWRVARLLRSRQGMLPPRGRPAALAYPSAL
jgi:hypothetical protein